jgi:hypothetical protein
MRAWVAVVCVALGCGDDSGSGPADAAVDAAPDAATAACPIAGRWVMTTVFCNTTDITNDVRTQGGITEMRLDFTTVAGKPCHMAGTYTGPMCTEVEEHDLRVDNGSFVLELGGGIASCSPAACKFNSGDAACAMGDRANTGNGLTTAVVQGTSIVVTNRPPEGLCQSFGQNTITTFVKQ